jgi:hypothetical protein
MSTILSGSTRRSAASTPASGSLRVLTGDRISDAELAQPEAIPFNGELLLRDLHWTRPGGTVCFSTGETRAAADERRRRWEAAAEDFGDAEFAATYRAVVERKGKPATSFKGLPRPAAAFHSETLRAAVLRTDWSPSAVQLAVDWSQPEIRCEISIGRDVVLSGPMTSRVVVGGRVLGVTSSQEGGPWREVCWLSDDEADFLELETSLGDGIRLQRQFTLLRRDGLLLAADALLGAQGFLGNARSDLECAWSLPFAPQAKFASADETRDMRVTLGRRATAILPLALPEWRVERADGDLSIEEGVLQVRQTARQAVGLFAPVAFVVDSKRAKRELTWRRLTVGEHLAIQPADRAVGYRIQSGREQWLVYRSLTPRANRTVLGVNLQTNFLFARFNADGVSDRLIEIED